MGKRIFVILMVAMLALTLPGCSDKSQQRYEAQFLQLFDTVTVIVGYADSEESFQEHADLIHDELETYHQLYDIYHDYSGVNNIKTINEHAGQEPVKVDQKIIDMLLFAKEAYERTDGQINVAMGSVLRIWHNHREEGIDDPIHASLPSMDELVAAAEHTDINDLVINLEESTVFLKDKDMLLDVGAIAKGYSVEQVSQFAKEHGFTDGLISVGGNVRALGHKGDDQQLWGIGIQNPDSEAENTNLFVAHLSDLSVVTSGDYERYYTVDGRQYHHIIDPETLYPADYFTAVTIITPDSGMADELSTAVYNMPQEQGEELIESTPNTEALWVYHDGTTVFSSGFEQYINQ